MKNIKLRAIRIEYDVDYSKIKMCAGRIDKAYAAEVTLIKDCVAKITWVDPFIFRDQKSGRQDLVYAYIYNHTKGYLSEFLTSTLREDHSYFFSLSEFDEGDEIHFWLAMHSPKNGWISDSCYAGGLVVSLAKEDTIKKYQKDQLEGIAFTILCMLHEMILLHAYNVLTFTCYPNQDTVEPFGDLPAKIKKILLDTNDPVTDILSPLYTFLWNSEEELMKINNWKADDILTNHYILSHVEEIFFNFCSKIAVPKNLDESLDNLHDGLVSILDFIFVFIQLIENGELELAWKDQDFRLKRIREFDKDRVQYSLDKNQIIFCRLYKDLEVFPSAIYEYKMKAQKSAG